MSLHHPTPPGAAVAAPPVVDDVLVPVSASASSEAALEPAAELAHTFGAQVHLLGVGIEQEEADALAKRLTVLGVGLGAQVETRVDWDVAAAILGAAREHANSLVCMASHARGRLGEAVLGSFTTALLAEADEPVVLVGPEYDAVTGLTDGPVLACVDGRPTSEQVLPVAAGWASALQVGLRVVTVAEPAGRGLDDRPSHRAYAPHGHPQAYVDALAHRWGHPGGDVSGLVVYHPLGAGPGLAAHLRGTRGGLVAVTTHARTGLRRAVFGSQAAAIVRHSPVPVLTVPPARS